jgi:hypothetical protein
MLIGLLLMSPPAATLPWSALTLGFDGLLSPSLALNLTTAQMPAAMSFRKSQMPENMTPPDMLTRATGLVAKGGL